MPLVAEDGTGLADANTFVTRAELIAYAAARGVVVPDDDSSDVHLVKAMDALELLEYAGDITYPEQGTFFPRLYADVYGNEYWPSDEVPAAVKKAQLILALTSFQGTPLLAPIGAGPVLKRRKVGPMEREFDNASGSTVARVPGVAELLRSYLAGGGGIQLSAIRV